MLQQAVQLSEEWPTSVICENCPREPRIWWGKIPRGCSLLPLLLEFAISPSANILNRCSTPEFQVNHWKKPKCFAKLVKTNKQSDPLGLFSRTYPSGWCRIPTKSSTARAEAIGARPGRVTVHCWSKVRLAVDCTQNKRLMALLDMHTAANISYLLNSRKLHQ